MKKYLLFISFGLTILLTACGNKLEGTYVAGQGMFTQQLIFNTNGKVIFDTMGMKQETNYEMEGKNIKFISPSGTSIMTMIDKNTIEGPMGIKYIKTK